LINAYCHHCGLYLTIPDEFAGGVGACPRCHTRLRIPVPFSPNTPGYDADLRYYAFPRGTPTDTTSVSPSAGKSHRFICECGQEYESLKSAAVPPGRCPACGRENAPTGPSVQFMRLETITPPTKADEFPNDDEFLFTKPCLNQIKDKKVLQAVMIQTPQQEDDLPVAKVLQSTHDLDLRVSVLRTRAYRLQIAFGSALGMAVILILMALVRDPLQKTEGGLYSVILTGLSAVSAGFLVWTLIVLGTLRGGQFFRLPRRARWQGLFAVMLLVTILGGGIGMQYLNVDRPTSALDKKRVEFSRTVIDCIRNGESHELLSLVDFDHLSVNGRDFGSQYREGTLQEGQVMVEGLVDSLKDDVLPKRGRLLVRVTGHTNEEATVGVFVPTSAAPILQLSLSGGMIRSIDVPKKPTLKVAK
jgi:hypothetical protein